MINKIKIFFREVAVEARKVDWPTKKEAFNHALIVVGISFSVALFLGFLDFIFMKIIEQIIL